MSSEERMVAARLWAAYNYPYLASALFAMRFISDETVGGWQEMNISAYM